MKKIILIIGALFFLSIGYSQNCSINVDVTAHSCCDDNGFLQAERNGYYSYGTTYYGPDNYEVTFVSPLFLYVDTKVWGNTEDYPLYCIIHDGGPSVHTWCYGEEHHMCGNSSLPSLDFDLHLNVLEDGEPGPPPPEE